MNALVILGTVILANLGPSSVGFHDFTILPKVPFEATTFHQDALVREAQAMRADNREKEPVEACNALIADKTLPFVLRSWAVRQKMKLCTYARREWEAIHTGRAWLDAHGDQDPHAKEIRVVMGQIMSQRGHGGFVPLFEDAQKVFDDIFEHHPPDTLLIIQSHVNYAILLMKLAPTDAALYQLCVIHYAIADAALEKYLEERGDELNETFRVSYEQRLEGIKMEIQRFMDGRRPQVKMTEQEYIDLRRQRDEKVREMRQERIDSGEIDPEAPREPETYAW